jgi:hypothetical protein
MDMSKKQTNIDLPTEEEMAEAQALMDEYLRTHFIND